MSVETEIALSDEAKAHVRSLMEQGATACGISRAAGLSDNTTARAMRSGHTFTARTAGKILAVTIEQCQVGRSLGGNPNLDLDLAARATEHVRALKEFGATGTDIARCAGLSHHPIYNADAGRLVSKDSAEKILAVTRDDVAGVMETPLWVLILEEYAYFTDVQGYGHGYVVRLLAGQFGTKAEYVEQIVARREAAA